MGKADRPDIDKATRKRLYRYCADKAQKQLAEFYGE